VRIFWEVSLLGPEEPLADWGWVEAKDVSWICLLQRDVSREVNSILLSKLKVSPSLCGGNTKCYPDFFSVIVFLTSIDDSTRFSQCSMYFMLASSELLSWLAHCFTSMRRTLSPSV